MLLKLIGIGSVWGVVVGAGGCAASPAPATAPVALSAGALAEARESLLATDAAWGEAGFTDATRWPRSFWAADAAMGSVSSTRQVFGVDAISDSTGVWWDRDASFALKWRPTHAWVSADGITGCTIGEGTSEIQRLIISRNILRG